MNSRQDTAWDFSAIPSDVGSAAPASHRFAPEGPPRGPVSGDAGQGRRPGPATSARSSTSYRSEAPSRGRSSTSAGPNPGSAPAAGRQNDPEIPETADFWPDLRPKLTSDHVVRNLQLDCPICASDSAEIRIISCGHMFCKSCVIRIIKRQDGPEDNPNGSRRECPFCKVALGRKRHCARECPADTAWTTGLPMPKTLREVQDFPLMLPEGGGKPECCASCHEARVEDALSALCCELLNSKDKYSGIKAFEASRSFEDVEAQGDEYWRRVPELQGLCDTVMGLIYDRGFNKKYTGILPPSSSQPGHPRRAMARTWDRVAWSREGQ